MARWSDDREAVLADLETLRRGLGALEGRVTTLEAGQPEPSSTPTPTPTPAPSPTPTPTPTVESILSLEDQRALKELYDKWERVAVRFEAAGITFDWRDSNNGAHHLERNDPDQFKPTVAEAYAVWLRKSEGTRVAKRG